MSGSQSIKTHKKQSEQRVPHVAAPKIKLHAQRVQQQEAAAAALEERGFRSALIEAVQRATIRSRELGGK